MIHAKIFPSCWKHYSPVSSPTVARAEAIRNGQEVAKLHPFDQPTIEIPGSIEVQDRDEWASYLSNTNENRLAENMVKILDIAQDNLLFIDALTEYLEPTPHVRAHDQAAHIHDGLAEIVRLAGAGIEPYIKGAIKEGSA